MALVTVGKFGMWVGGYFFLFFGLGGDGSFVERDGD